MNTVHAKLCPLSKFFLQSVRIVKFVICNVSLSPPHLPILPHPMTHCSGALRTLCAIIHKIKIYSYLWLKILVLYMQTPYRVTRYIITLYMTAIHTAGGAARSAGGSITPSHSICCANRTEQHISAVMLGHLSCADRMPGGLRDMIRTLGSRLSAILVLHIKH